jgi:hypothetical protein
MVSVTMNAPQPAPVASNIVVDSKGRRITIREPNLLEESRLIRALGEHANNTNYVMLYCMPAAMVAKIDDVDMIFPTAQSHVDAAIQAIGREGMAAVMDYITAAAKQKAQDEEAIKKSAGTPDSEKPAG